MRCLRCNRPIKAMTNGKMLGPVCFLRLGYVEKKTKNVHIKRVMVKNVDFFDIRQATIFELLASNL
jgi:hypothetical protein